MDIKIYKNYGILMDREHTLYARGLYTYGAPNATATCWDEMTVRLPAGWGTYENPANEVIVTDPWGKAYTVNEVLCASRKGAAPIFLAYDEHTHARTYPLEVVKV